MRLDRSLPLALALALASASTAAPALAGDLAPRRVAVSTRGIDFTQPDAAREVYARIRAAARRVCSAAEGRSPAQHAAWNACRREATERAVASLGDPSVAQLHAARARRAAAAS